MLWTTTAVGSGKSRSRRSRRFPLIRLRWDLRPSGEHDVGGCGAGGEPGRPAFVDGGGVALVPRSLTLEDPPGRDRRLAVVQVVDGALVDTGEHVATLEAPWLVVVQP